MSYADRGSPTVNVAGVIGLGTFALLFIVALAALFMWGCPTYNVWEQGLAGQAELKRAEQNRQIKIQEAKALEESAEHLKAAEIKRAEGVAAANKIIGESLKGNESYLHYLWIHNLAEAEQKGAQVIYVPTEANLPILEAGRFGGPSKLPEGNK